MQRAPVFRALTRPQMFGGVTYSYFVVNMGVTTEAFLVTRSFWAMPTQFSAGPKAASG